MSVENDCGHLTSELSRQWVCGAEQTAGPTFGITAAWNQIMQSAVVSANLSGLSWLSGCYQVPNKVLDLLVAFVHLQAVQQLFAGGKRKFS